MILLSAVHKFGLGPGTAREFRMKAPRMKAHLIIKEGKQRQRGDGSRHFSQICMVKTWFMTSGCLSVTKPVRYHYLYRRNRRACRRFRNLMMEETISLNLLWWQPAAGHSSTVNLSESWRMRKARPVRKSSSPRMMPGIGEKVKRSGCCVSHHYRRPVRDYIQG